jgi:hypothetical protein
MLILGLVLTTREVVMASPIRLQVKIEIVHKLITNSDVTTGARRRDWIKLETELIELMGPFSSVL